MDKSRYDVVDEWMDELEDEFEALENAYPTCPLDTSYTTELRKLMNENPTLPVVVFANGERLPDGAYGHCSRVRCELIEYLDVRTPWSIMRVERSREDFAHLIEDQLRRYPADYGAPEGVNLDEWVRETAAMEAEKWDSYWVKAIAIFVDGE